MKKMIILAVIVLLSLLLPACTAWYGNEKQYERGDWYGVAGSKEVAQIQRDKLAIQKLKGLPAQGDKALGYKGVVVNRSRHYAYTFLLHGPEKKSYFLEPGSRTEDFLIPGQYRFKIKRGGKIVGWGEFGVGPQIQRYDNQDYHWFCYADR